MSSRISPNEPNDSTPSDAWVRTVRRRLLSWGPEHFQDYPWRGRVPFWQALVAEILLQRTRAPQVAPVFTELRRRYPLARDFAAAPERELRELLIPLGLHWRIPLIVKLAREVGHRRGRLPGTVEGLRELPGVGDYAAAAAVSLHRGRYAVVLDSNVVRLLCRLTGQPWDGETRRKRWLVDFANRLTPTARTRDFNYALLDQSMLVCRPRRPSCGECTLVDLCSYAREARLGVVTTQLASSNSGRRTANPETLTAGR